MAYSFLEDILCLPIPLLIASICVSITPLGDMYTCVCTCTHVHVHVYAHVALYMYMPTLTTDNLTLLRIMKSEFEKRTAVQLPCDPAGIPEEWLAVITGAKLL